MSDPLEDYLSRRQTAEAEDDPLAAYLERRAEPAARVVQPSRFPAPDIDRSDVITKDAKPAFDPTGETARVQSEIRKGAPGEPLADAEKRANDTRLANDPVHNDWIAQELISGTVAGPVLGKALGAAGKAASSIGEGAIARSAAREPGAVKEALSEGAKAITHATGHGAIGHYLGEAVGVPGLGTAIGVARSVPTIARSAGVVADEGAAAIARRLMKSRAAAPVAEEAAAVAPAALSENPQIRSLQEALPTATPEQADLINKAIAGIEARVAAPARASAAIPVEASQGQRAAAILESRALPREVNPFDEVTHATPITPIERAKFAQELRAAHGGDIPGVTDIPAGVKTATSEQPTVATPATPAKPAWEPSKADEKFARKMHMTLDEYRAKMGRVFGDKSAAASTPAWSPSSADAIFAKQLGMSVDAYRAMMVRRMAQQPASP